MHRLLSLLYVAMLYLAGAAHWGLFLGGGSMRFSHEDWVVAYSYYTIVHEAVGAGVLPYHSSAPLDNRGSDRFMGLPNTPLSPQFLLLGRVGFPWFVVINGLLLYTVSALGCLALRREHRLGWIPFTFLFLIFNFNGFITAHLSAGQTAFFGYFFLPWVL